MAKKIDNEAFSYEQEVAAYQAARATWAELERETERLRVAALWMNTSETDRAADRCSWLRQKFDEYFANDRVPASWRLPALSAEVNERLELARPQWLAAQQRFEVARARETSRLAIPMQDRQRRLVREIAEHAEGLSNAIESERALHDELARTAPNATSPFLAPCSPAVTPMGVHGSKLNVWRSKMHALGLL
jgi:hypothetical protein